MSYVFWRIPSLIKLRPKKKGYSRLVVGWNVWGFHQLGLFWRVPWSNYDRKKKNSCLAIGCNVGLFWRVRCYVFWWVPWSNYKLWPEKRGTVIWLPYTICNTRNILFLLCLYLKWGNKLNIGIVWFEGKAPSQTSKTRLTMVEPFAGPSSMAMGNQPMPSRYPLRKRLSEGGVQGFL